MTKLTNGLLLIGLLMLSGKAETTLADDLDVHKQVRNTEMAFAQTMANRDFTAFAAFLDEEAVFFSGETPLEGKDAVVGVWESYYEGEAAPFSWKPETVAVLESGALALSSGPVFNSSGERVATFNSIWRLDQNGEWKIIFDKGYSYCEPPDVDSAE